MRNKIAPKGTPESLSRSMARALAHDLEHLLRLAAAGKPISQTMTDFRDALEAQILNHRDQILVSPYSNVSDESWLEAYEEAAQEIYEREDSEREPSIEEINHALDSIRERRREERRRGECA